MDEARRGRLVLLQLQAQDHGPRFPADGGVYALGHVERLNEGSEDEKVDDIADEPCYEHLPLKKTKGN